MYYPVSTIAMMSGLSQNTVRRKIIEGVIDDKHIKKGGSKIMLDVDCLGSLRESKDRRITLDKLVIMTHGHLGQISQMHQIPIESVYKDFTQKIMSEIGQN